MHRYKKPFRILRFWQVFTLLLLTSLLLTSPSYSNQFNGFIIESPLIPVTEIHHGGPPRDGIPSIDRPHFISASQAGYLLDTDRVLGINIGRQAKAYPVRILNWHEIVNDGNVLITYCPLCGTGMAFSTHLSNFGVSGLLFNSDMLLYDRATESLWSQILGRAISGKLKGQYLKMLPLEHTSWSLWRETHPETLVLSTQTGYSRPYTRSPYGDYHRSDTLYFPVAKQNRRYHPKETVIGIRLNGQYKAYPFIELDKSGKSIINDELAGEKIDIIFNRQHRSGYIVNQSGETIPTITSYWFAWYAFHPDTEVYTNNAP